MKNRPEFHKLIVKCQKKKVDLILTKSISRFSRNTLDMLRILQNLHDSDVDVYFEQENMWLNQQQIQLLLTTYCAFAQAESENMSQNIKWGIRRGFQNGTSGYAEFICFGYKQGESGKLTVDEPDAKIVQEIFKMRAAGNSLGAIGDYLHRKGIRSPRGNVRWSRETSSKLLQNEKYVGDVLLQKTFVEELFSGKQKKNMGQLEKFLMQEHHPAIISRELYAAVNNRI